VALVNCPECKREVSDTSLRCPHCGYKIKDSSSGGCLKVIGILVAIPVGLFALVFLFSLIKQGISPTDLKNSPRFAIDYGKENLEKNLKDPGSVEYGEVWAGRTRGSNGGEGTLVACGYFNARNGFGGMSGMKRFVAGPGGPVLIEQAETVAFLDIIWQETCVQNRFQ